MAAAAASLDAGGKPARKGPSLVVQGALLLATTAMALGIGWAGSGFLRPGGGEAPENRQPEAMMSREKPAGKEGGGEGAAAPAPGRPAVLPLPAMTVNLAAPTDTWLRLELALESPEPLPSGMADTIQGDLLAYLRTVKLYQIEGPSGFLQLRADLDERVRIRSQNKASRVLVRAMIFE